MKRLMTAMALTAALALPALAERADDANRASKNGLISGSIGGTGVTLEYGRPNDKGREIFGGLVPFGKVWRTGADEATTFEVDAPVVVEGSPLAAGRYGLFTIPGPDEWTFIFNKVPNQWGAFRYDASQDALRVTVESGSGDHVETMVFAIEDDRVVLRWEETEVGFRLGPNP